MSVSGSGMSGVTESAVTPAAAAAFLAKSPPVRVRGPREAQAHPRLPARSTWQEPLDERRKDVHGDPLPRGARARLGTVRFFCPGSPSELALSPDGKTLYAATQDGRIDVLAADTWSFIRFFAGRAARTRT